MAKYLKPTEHQRELSTKAFIEITEKATEYMLKDINIYCPKLFIEMTKKEYSDWVDKEMIRIADNIKYRLEVKNG